MNILLDECMMDWHPDGVFAGHTVMHVKHMGWESLQNGHLLRAAEGKFDVLITVDKNMPYQQSLKGLRILVVVLDIPYQSKDIFAHYLGKASALLNTFEPGSFNLVQ